MTLTPKQKLDLLDRGFSRRNFGKIASLLTAGASLPFYNEPALAQLSKIDNIPADAVIINANENPLGPSPEALEAAHKIIANGGRYLYNETDAVKAARAEAGRGLCPHVPRFERAAASGGSGVLFADEVLCGRGPRI